MGGEGEEGKGRRVRPCIVSLLISLLPSILEHNQLR